jgi:hypothetical protein
MTGEDQRNLIVFMFEWLYLNESVFLRNTIYSICPYHILTLISILKCSNNIRHHINSHRRFCRAVNRNKDERLVAVVGLGQGGGISNYAHPIGKETQSVGWPADCFVATRLLHLPPSFISAVLFCIHRCLGHDFPLLIVYDFVRSRIL